MVILKVGNDNTGPSVLNVNALGPKPIVHIDGTALDAGNMKANAIVCLMYDGAAFQMVWSSGGVAGVPGAPVFLTAPRTLYVNWATGNDATMDGTTAAAVAGTIHGPFKTPQRATDEINKYNLNGFNVQVYLADSLNYPSFALPRPSGSGNVGWQGNLATPSACVITGVNITAISASNCGQQIIAGMKVTASGNPNIVPDPICGIYISGGGSGVVVQDIEYGNCLGMQLVCARSAVVTMLGKQIITGNSPGSSFFNGGFVQAFALGFIQTGVNQPVFSAPAGPVTIPIFASASTGGNIGMSFQSIANAGNIIGKKYDVSFNACIVNGNRHQLLPRHHSGHDIDRRTICLTPTPFPFAPSIGCTRHSLGTGRLMMAACSHRSVSSSWTRLTRAIWTSSPPGRRASGRPMRLAYRPIKRCRIWSMISRSKSAANPSP
ncbi:hypothetical protein ACVWXQ_003069 [Bradyrhizobium sp. S3.14.4]